MPEREDDHLTPATRLLEKRREMAEVETALAAQKEVDLIFLFFQIDCGFVQLYYVGLDIINDIKSSMVCQFNLSCRNFKWKWRVYSKEEKNWKERSISSKSPCWNLISFWRWICNTVHCPSNFITRFQFYRRHHFSSTSLKIFQENDSKRARAVKKANDERDLKKTKDKEIERLFSFIDSSRSLFGTSVCHLQLMLATLQE